MINHVKHHDETFGENRKSCSDQLHLTRDKKSSLVTSVTRYIISGFEQEQTWTNIRQVVEMFYSWHKS